MAMHMCCPCMYLDHYNDKNEGNKIFSESWWYIGFKGNGGVKCFF